MQNTAEKLFADRFVHDERSDVAIEAMLRSRSEDMKSGKDKGMTFEEVFDEKLL